MSPHLKGASLRDLLPDTVPSVVVVQVALLQITLSRVSETVLFRTDGTVAELSLIWDSGGSVPFVRPKVQFLPTRRYTVKAGSGSGLPAVSAAGGYGTAPHRSS